MVVLVHLLQATERTIIPYLNKEETLEGLLNDGYRTWKNKLTNHPLWLTHYPKGTQRVQHALFITEKYYIEIIISSKSGGWLSYSVYPTELQIADLQIHLRGSVPFEHCQDFKPPF